MLIARSGTENDNNFFVIGLVTSFPPTGKGDIFAIYATKTTQVTAIDKTYAQTTPRKDRPDKTTATKKRIYMAGLTIS